MYTLLKEQILNGKLKGGERIPEETLAAQYGVSRTPIREAIRRLSEYGLVEIKPRSYAEVCAITPKEATDIAEVRVALEQLAIDTIDQLTYKEHIQDIARHAADCQYAMNIGDRAKVFEEDSLFHLALARASNNKELAQICERLDAKVQQLRIAQNLPEDKLAEYIGQHDDRRDDGGLPGAFLKPSQPKQQERQDGWHHTNYKRSENNSYQANGTVPILNGKGSILVLERTYERKNAGGNQSNGNYDRIKAWPGTLHAIFIVCH